MNNDFIIDESTALILEGGGIGNSSRKTAQSEQNRKCNKFVILNLYIH